MSKTIGKFDFEITKMSKDDSIPFDPILKICLKNYGGTTRDGSPTLSANLMTEREIDEHIQYLKADLDALSGKAKRALANAKEQTLNLVTSRPPST